MATKPLKDKTVAWAGLYRVRPGCFRLDFLPFLFIYSVLYAGVFTPPSSSSSLQGGTMKDDGIPLWVLVAMPIALLCHVLTHLLTHWFVACDAIVSYSKVRPCAKHAMDST